jgi:signal transduction histidine kinase/DNA-binding response OmpR family regulator/ligand-binding sensor domain-containing protein
MKEVNTIKDKRFKRSHRVQIQSILAFFFLGLFLQLASALYCQERGFTYIKNYSPKEYDHYPQNWGIAQAKNGIIYVANRAGVLEYDGKTWRTIYIDGITFSSLTIDNSGKVYIGGTNNIWHLYTDSTGTLVLKSLLEFLPIGYRNFDTVWSTHTTKEGIYFRSLKYLFRWDGKEIKIFEPDKSANKPNSFKASFIHNGELIVQEDHRGLLKVAANALIPIPGGKHFAGKRISVFVPYDKSKILIGIGARGFFLYNGTSSAPFPTEVDQFVKTKKLSHGTRLSSGDIALATNRGGIVIIDPQGRKKIVFDKTLGLQSDNVKYVFQDMHGNLWLCLGKGISKIDYSSPITIHDDRSHLTGQVLSVLKHNNLLFVGSSNGLYLLQSPLKFKNLIAITGSCWNLLSLKDSILAATSNGLFQIKGDKKMQITKTQSYTLWASKTHPGQVWCGTNEGLTILNTKNGQPRILSQLKMEQEIRSICEDNEGNAWLGTTTGTLIKVKFLPNDFIAMMVSKFNKSNGLPEGRNYVAWVKNHITIATPKGLFKKGDQEKTFVPDDTLGNTFTGGSKPVFRIAEDTNGHIWLHSESKNYHALLNSKGSYTISGKPFLRIPTTAQVNSIYPDPDGKIIWFATHEGLIRYNRTIEINYKQVFRTLIRKVMINKKLVFNGSHPNSSKDFTTPIHTMEYKNRKNIYIEFAAPFFQMETETRYRHLLEGHDDEWSDWSLNSSKEFSSLDSGSYTLRVQAINLYGQLGREGIYQFKILSPWYMTWWAFLLYFTALIFGIFLIVKRRSYVLEKEKVRLEKLVKERTLEVYEKNELLEEQSQKLKEMDGVKSRFFANISHEFRTPLTLIMGPLEQMMAQTDNNKQLEDFQMMQRNSKQLLNLINQLLDLSRFDSSKMELQASYNNIVPFIKGITAVFNNLAKQKNIKLEFQTEKETIFLFFDPSRLENAIQNLITNAFKFTPNNRHIKVSITISQYQQSEAKGAPIIDYIEISIKDSGMGIPHEHMGKIFERFYQAQNQLKSQQTGTGIGLALTKEIILLHHGTIDAHSQEGKGTEFVIRIPMGKDHLKQDEIIEWEAPKPLKWEVPTPTPSTQTQSPESVSPDDANVILVVEDNTDVRKFIRGPLEDKGYKVIEAVDGNEGIEMAKTIIPDLIISDIMMPEVDGYVLCKTLKNDINTSHIPIIMLTAKASEENIFQGLDTRADDYITKPFNMQLLIKRIQNLIELRRQMQLKIQRKKMLLPADIQVSSMDDTFLKEFFKIIDKNFTDPEFSIKTLCYKLTMSRSTLFRKIQQLTGKTPNHIIMDFRLERAAQLLKEHFGNITEVALEVGFSTSQYFAKCFKEKYNTTPKEFSKTT